MIRPDGSPGFMYDVGVNPATNRMTTSSWSHPDHVKGGTHLENAGRYIVVWDWESKEIVQVAEVDPAPFAIRWMHGPEARGGFTCAALGGSIWYCEDADEDGQLEFHRVLDLGEGSVPVDMRVSYDNRYLARPVHRPSYEEDADLAALAAAYCFGIARNHPFGDGNKRMAFLSAYVFLGLNGWDVEVEEAELVLVILETAAGERDEGDLAQWFRGRMVPR